MHTSDETTSPPPQQGFTVLIPRALRPSVEALPSELRQALLAELFRMASMAWRQRGSLPGTGPHTLYLHVRGCEARIELDAAATRVTLASVRRLAESLPGAASLQG